MSGFKIGDVVKCTSRRGGADMVFGLVGGVVDVRKNHIGVDWYDGAVDGHTCGGRCADGFGWYVLKDDLVKHITFKGNK